MFRLSVLAALVTLSACVVPPQETTPPTGEPAPVQEPMQGGAMQPQPPGQPEQVPGQVIVNGVALPGALLTQFEQQYRMRIPPGAYWYDTVSGAWGMQGGPAAGFTSPGLALGGPLRADASGGGNGMVTAVFINGREIHPVDLVALQQLGPVAPGRYWIDGYGNYGVEGGPAVGNLVQLMQARGGQGSAYQRRTTSGYIGGDGNTSYFFDPSTGASVIPGEGVSY